MFEIFVLLAVPAAAVALIAAWRAQRKPTEQKKWAEDELEPAMVALLKAKGAGSKLTTSKDKAKPN
ncbi:hypothetical protein [Ferrimonas marina]|uniref:Uncharacterized protein n=1 Tax=Ferrimonas marina TaxID=299255 RepID=A0A1M5N202_9GAMM|nr:hypothetical protein [Ferrimonas marina]SHG83584.1 hypothetical protein SAMN02745129_0868 [Ferrimonas marina]